jgi:hypothetical protein
MKDYLTEFTQTDGDAFPDTGAINASGAGATDGTEFIAALINDIWGARQAAMDVAGLTPNAVEEQATVDLTKPSGRKSQFLDAMFKLFERRAYCEDSGAGTANAIQADAIAGLFEFYQDRMIVILNPAVKNTGATTIDIDGLGAQAVVSPDGFALGGGEFQPDQIAILVYDLSNTRFEYINIPQGATYDLSETVAVIQNTTIIPYDDTKPQNTEGTEILTATITPTNKNSTIRIEALVKGSVATSGDALIAALFRDSNADAIEVGIHDSSTGGNLALYGVKVEAEVAAVDTVATTFKLRVGGDAGNAWTVNGISGARVFGGAMITSLRVTEILPKL